MGILEREKREKEIVNEKVTGVSQNQRECWVNLLWVLILFPARPLRCASSGSQSVKLQFLICTQVRHHAVQTHHQNRLLQDPTLPSQK